MMLDLARGMAYITSQPDHSMRMNDNLKSNNVLVSRDWDVKVADYGHSNIRELARTLTSVGNIAWTGMLMFNKKMRALNLYLFSAPEILNGESATVKITIFVWYHLLGDIH